jgi:two-component system, NarL family, response regulator DegU
MEQNVTNGNKEPAEGRPRLVLADDDPIVRSVLGRQLRRSFECVGAAADADEALALVQQHRPDVALLDVNMPGGGAARVTRELRERFPGTAIVILSIDEEPSEVIDLLRSGATTYLRKGIGADELIEKLSAAIEAHAARTAAGR